MGDDYPVVEAEPIDYSYVQDESVWLFPAFSNDWNMVINSRENNLFFNKLDLEAYKTEY